MTAWSREQVLGQSGLHRETLPQKTNVSNINCFIIEDFQVPQNTVTWLGLPHRNCAFQTFLFVSRCVAMTGLPERYAQPGLWKHRSLSRSRPKVRPQTVQRTFLVEESGLMHFGNQLLKLVSKSFSHISVVAHTCNPSAPWFKTSAVHQSRGQPEPHETQKQQKPWRRPSR